MFVDRPNRADCTADWEGLSGGTHFGRPVSYLYISILMGGDSFITSCLFLLSFFISKNPTNVFIFYFLIIAFSSPLGAGV